jgi:hypothetical protein
MMCIDLTLNNIIDYCDTWYGINCSGFKAMFTNPTYTQVGDDFLENESYNKETIERVSVINICGFLGMDDNGPFSYDSVNIDEAHGSSTPMEWALSWL